MRMWWKKKRFIYRKVLSDCCPGCARRSYRKIFVRRAGSLLSYTPPSFYSTVFILICYFLLLGNGPLGKVSCLWWFPTILSQTYPDSSANASSAVSLSPSNFEYVTSDDVRPPLGMHTVNIAFQSHLCLDVLYCIKSYFSGHQTYTTVYPVWNSKDQGLYSIYSNYICQQMELFYTKINKSHNWARICYKVIDLIPTINQLSVCAV